MAYGNRFLDALPPEIAGALADGEAPRELPFGGTIVRRGEAQPAVHFPTSGAISDIEEQPDGGSAEVGAIGPEGVSGIEIVLGIPAAPVTRLIQTPTRAFAVPCERIVEAYEQHPPLRLLAHRYVVAMLRAGGISVACNARHRAVQRLARWLLRMADRARTDDVALTHDATALMLGVRRATVTASMHALELSRTIETARGVVRILDRAGLETESCSCYGEERTVYEELYGSAALSASGNGASARE